MKIPIGSISTGRNYRTQFDDGALRDLADSMRDYGLIQPITVRPCAGGYELLAGERRLRAALLLGWSEIDATIKDADENAASAITLSENMGRKDTNPMEDARAFAKLRDRGMTEDEIARMACVRPAMVSSRLALLRLRPDVQDLVARGILSVGYAKALADSNLDAARQAIALRRYSDNPAPTLTWFASECATLYGEQVSEPMALFADVQTVTLTKTAKTALPDTPSTTRRKMAGDGDMRARILDEVSYWRSEAAKWGALGHTAQARECEAAVNVLAATADMFPAPKRCAYAVTVLGAMVQVSLRGYGQDDAATILRGLGLRYDGRKKVFYGQADSAAIRQALTDYTEVS